VPEFRNLLLVRSSFRGEYISTLRVFLLRAGVLYLQVKVGFISFNGHQQNFPFMAC